MCSKMEQPFYHDDSLLSAYSRTDSGLLKGTLGHLAETYRLPKHDMSYYPTQDSSSHHTAPGSLKMAAPELERLIIHSGPGVLNGSNGGQLYYAPRGGGGGGITEDQEGFVDGFVKALDDLHKMNRDVPPNVSLGGSSGPMAGTGSSPPAGIYSDAAVYANLTSYHQSCYRQPSATINYLPQGHGDYGASPFKEEPQTVPDAGGVRADSRESTPTPLSPINMEEQEKIKVERKRLRNRLAATKCRRRKLERIARLEDKVRELKNENSGLSGTAGALREQVEQLKIRVREHARHGCQLLLGSKGHQVF
ncbi:transcription factor JunB [Spea bombifrons]|uniref:transcription factor JunB n=1 Tax=Spea bombifrons TaxID=233779 RepID=UPI00234A3005|nr:transcription factor JunB [Spea bombifrons]